MKISVFGESDFIGSYRIDAPIAAGMQPVVLVRPGNDDRLRLAIRFRAVPRDVGNRGAATGVPDGADAVIHNMGILRELPARGIASEEMQEKPAPRIIDAAAQLGLGRFLRQGIEPRPSDAARRAHLTYRRDRASTWQKSAA